MRVYQISYDLHVSGQNYASLTERIRAYGYYCHLQQSVWVICTTQSATEVRDNLNACLDSNDKLFVARLAGEAAWSGYGTEISEWLKNQLGSQRAA